MMELRPTVPEPDERNVQKLTPDSRRLIEAAALEAFIDSTVPQHLRTNFDRDISMLRGGWNAALKFMKGSLPKWRREPPDEIGLWWWWNEDEDSSSIPIEIALSGGTEPPDYFAMAGQYGWNRAQPVKEMGGLWMPCIEPVVPGFEEREALLASTKPV